MKKYIIGFIAGCGFLFVSCERWLDISPEMGISEEDVFGDYVSMRGYLDICYRSLLDIHSADSQRQYAPIVAMSDECIFNYHLSPIRRRLNPGLWMNAEDAPEVGWSQSGVTSDAGLVIPNSFFCIRVCNEILEALETKDNLTQEEYEYIKGQALFFRAWYYFQIIIRWGGMPILDRVFELGEPLDLPRLTYHESTEWLIGDLDLAIGLLPHTWPENDIGRATKAAAMSVRSMAALYDASPSMCPENGYQYDVDRCKTAARYAKEVLDYLDNDSYDLPYSLMPFTGQGQYLNIFSPQTPNYSAESLWYKINNRQRNANKSLKCLYMNARMANGTGFWPAMHLEPTQNIADKFEVKVGDVAYEVTDPNAGFTMNNMAKNRDPRFNWCFLYAGAGSFGSDPNNDNLFFEMWNDQSVGGAGRDWVYRTTLSSTKGSNPTGYVCRKFLWSGALASNPNGGNFNNRNINTVYIRVSQIYLDYAEAMNEAYGPTGTGEVDGVQLDLSAVDALNALRRRMAWPDVNPDYYVTQKRFRDKIRDERAVELMMENHRWWDLRRWRIAHEVLAKPIYGLNATLTNRTGNNPSQYAYTYERVVVDTEQRVFGMRHYWYPIPLIYQQTFENFNQNEGW